MQHKFLFVVENTGLSLFIGDRLISVNSVSLEGVSHHSAIEILQNAPEDVTLVISQPKEKISKGNVVSVSQLCILFHFFTKTSVL